MTADDRMKSLCVWLRVGGFQNPGVCLQAFPSFLPLPSPFFYLLHFRAAIPTETVATQARIKGIGLLSLSGSKKPLPINSWFSSVM